MSPMKATQHAKEHAAEPVPIAAAPAVESVDARGVLTWVRGELGRFAVARLASPSAAARALAAAATPPPTQLHGPLATLMTLLVARPADLFLIGWLGAVEADAAVGAVVGELQADERGAPGSARPGAELVVALLRTLFHDAPIDPLALLALPSVAAGVVEVAGDGPLPQRSLAVEPRLFALLSGGRPAWPGTRHPAATSGATQLPAAAAALLDEAVAALRDGARGVVVRGSPFSGRDEFATRLARVFGQEPLEVPLERWQAERTLGLACRCAGWLPMVLLDGASEEALARGVLSGARGPLVALASGASALPDEGLLELELPLPDCAERRARWHAHFDAAEPAAALAESLAEAPLAFGLIDRIARHAKVVARASGRPLDAEQLAVARRRIGVAQLRALAQPIEREVADGALVLPASLAAELEQLIERCRRRDSLWQGLGTTLSSGGNAGVRALLVGESGTGKTLAASRVATALGIPLWRVDLGALMSKWVGESEKNLGRLLDVAAALDVILLFDEADALFGQRSDAGETGERYLNMLTNHLLTRLEAFAGIALLTANSRTRIDPAFLRRLDVVLDFPLPAPAERRRLWQAHLGDRAPPQAELDFLASWCDLAGGHVKNAVLAASTRCRAGRIPLALLQEALADEYRKLGRAAPGQLLPRPSQRRS
ncbi:MAG: ATP-binding protein [Planctomycetes bacterium]|nr:ATP-binding protein [Planctomycetota bacterium]